MPETGKADDVSLRGDAPRQVPGRGITIDDARFPLVIATYVGAVQKGDYEAAFARYAEIAARSEPLVWLIDMRRFDPLRVDAVARRLAAGVFERYRKVLVPVSVAEARVIEGFVTRNVVTAFDWLTGANKWPCQQFGEVARAEAWLYERYRARTGKSLTRA